MRRRNKHLAQEKKHHVGKKHTVQGNNENHSQEKKHRPRKRRTKNTFRRTKDTVPIYTHYDIRIYRSEEAGAGAGDAQADFGEHLFRSASVSSSEDICISLSLSTYIRVTRDALLRSLHIYIYIYIYICVCVHMQIHIYI